MLPIASDVIDRVELGRIARQPLDCRPALLCADGFAHHTRPAAARPTPPTVWPKVAEQMAEKVPTRWPRIGGVEPELKAPADDSGGGRQHLTS
jgi:hypothetical protein